MTRERLRILLDYAFEAAAERLGQSSAQARTTQASKTTSNATASERPNTDESNQTRQTSGR